MIVIGADDCVVDAATIVVSSDEYDDTDDVSSSSQLPFTLLSNSISRADEDNDNDSWSAASIRPIERAFFSGIRV